MIHPYFIDDEGKLISRTELLRGRFRTWMFVLIEEMFDFHRKRLFVGSEFYCQEGSKSVAKGIVTKLVGLS